MAADEANRKKNNSSRVQVQLEMEMIQDLNIYKSTSNNEPSSHIDSEADSEAAEDDDEYRYSPLNGDSDIEDDISNTSDESIALLLHEITCCECETDTETENEKDNEHAKESNEINENAKEITPEKTDNVTDKVGVNQNIQPKQCLGNPYKQLNNDTDDDNDDHTETLLLLGEDRISENYDINLLKNKLENPNIDDIAHK